MDNIILIGMPAASKSTIGVVIAKRLGYQFVEYRYSDSGRRRKTAERYSWEKGIDGFLEVEDRVNAKVDTWQYGNIAGRQRSILRKCHETL